MYDARHHVGSHACGFLHMHACNTSDREEAVLQGAPGGISNAGDTEASAQRLCRCHPAPGESIHIEWTAEQSLKRFR